MPGIRPSKGSALPAWRARQRAERDRVQQEASQVINLDLDEDIGIVDNKVPTAISRTEASQAYSQFRNQQAGAGGLVGWLDKDEFPVIQEFQA